MKTIVVFASVLAVAFSIPTDTYNPEYENFNAQEIVENVRLLRHYALCFLRKGPCTSEGLEFRNLIPEALRTSCGKCTSKQKELIRTIIKGFQTKVPDLWQELIEQEDPKREYQESFENFLNGSD